ncbi:hypothetical protein J0H58_38435 [bacterium]|nr:hypothetical protein [bacterium]
MFLTCPTCASGLQVPDGTTAHVRCPACKTVFPADAGLAPAEVVEVPPPPPPSARRPTPPPRRPEPKPEPPVNRDFDPEPPRDPKKPAKRVRPDDSKFTPAERRVLRGQFTRGMWGCRLICFGYLFQMMALFVFHGVLRTIPTDLLAYFPSNTYLVAGFGGLLNLLLVPVGLGLVLSSRPVPGLYRFGWAAVAATAVHAVLVFAVVARADTVPLPRGVEVTRAIIVFQHLMTKLDALTYYIAAAVYPNESPFDRPGVVLDLLTGFAEMVRLVLVMVTIGAAAKGAGDKELNHKCIRAAGIGSFGPAVLAMATVLFMASMIETGGRDTKFGLVLFHVYAMGLYAMLAWTLVPVVEVSRLAAEACQYPYESQNFEIGD